MVRNVETVFVWLQKVSVPDISSLPLPLTESEAKQTNVRQSSRLAFVALTEYIALAWAAYPVIFISFH